MNNQIDQINQNIMEPKKTKSKKIEFDVNGSPLEIEKIKKPRAPKALKIIPPNRYQIDTSSNYYGSKPMSITWELSEPMPPYFWKETAKMAVG